MEYLIKTNNLTKKYKNFKVLDNVNLHIEPSSIYGLIGKNGAGKTTLIRIICGLQEPTNGSYSIYGISFKDKKIYEEREKINAIVETPSLILNMTAKENLIHQYKIIGMPSLDGIDEILELVNLKEFKNKKVSNFSLGMKQRLGIALSLATNPDLLILDEPINGLDPEGIIDIRELILKLNKEKGITILLSSHYLDELSKVASHYGFLDKGKLIKEISAQELNQYLRKKVEIEVNNIKEAVKYFEEKNIDYEVLNNSLVYLYGKINISKIILDLAKKNCLVKDIKEKNESLENYFLKVVGENND